MNAFPCAVLTAACSKVVLALVTVGARDDGRMSGRQAGQAEAASISLAGNNARAMASTTNACASKFVQALSARGFEYALDEVSAHDMKLAVAVVTLFQRGKVDQA